MSANHLSLHRVSMLKIIIISWMLLGPAIRWGQAGKAWAWARSINNISNLLAAANSRFTHSFSLKFQIGWCDGVWVEIHLTRQYRKRRFQFITTAHLGCHWNRNREMGIIFKMNWLNWIKENNKRNRSSADCAENINAGDLVARYVWSHHGSILSLLLLSVFFLVFLFELN